MDGSGNLQLRAPPCVQRTRPTDLLGLTYSVPSQALGLHMQSLGRQILAAAQGGLEVLGN